MDINDRRRLRERIRLGDAVEVVAQPIAKGIDKVLGTNIQECGGCKKRKDWLNRVTGQRSARPSGLTDFNETGRNNIDKIG